MKRPLIDEDLDEAGLPVLFGSLTDWGLEQKDNLGSLTDRLALQLADTLKPFRKDF